jgi:hypothetical protein
MHHLASRTRLFAFIPSLAAAILLGACQAAPAANSSPDLASTVTAQVRATLMAGPTATALPAPTAAPPATPVLAPTAAPRAVPVVSPTALPIQPLPQSTTESAPSAAAPPPNTTIIILPPAQDSAPTSYWIVCVWCDFGSHDPRPDADRVQRQLVASGFSANVIWSSDYPGLSPGYWVTYSGLFAFESDAQSHLAALSSAGFAGRLRPIGGIVSAQRVAEAPFWTAIVRSASTWSEAETSANILRRQGIAAGTLYSSNYASLNPGYWVTYVGRFADRASAALEATRLRGAGYAGAYAREVRQ